VASGKEQLVDDVEFIFAEAVRFKQMTEQWLETKQFPAELKEAWFWEIDHGDGKPHLTIGRNAMRRLERLAEFAAHREGIDRQVDLLTVRKPLARSLVRRFIAEGRELTVSQVERAMSEAARRAASQRQTVTHYIPCHLMLAQEPVRFSIGPITFLRRAEFRSVLAQLLWQSRGKGRPSKHYMRDVTKYFSAFSWVAEIRVPNCDSDTSSKVAEQAVVASLNCLHLLFGPGHTRKMAVGGPAIVRDTRGSIAVHGSELRVSASYTGPGAVAFEDDWMDRVKGGDWGEILRLFGVALESAVDPILIRPMSERFLDAARWYGEAVRETSSAAKVIKYVTALERMFMTDEKDNIADTVARRVATFCFAPTVVGDYERWQRDTRRAYDLRSKLAHGSMSTSDPLVHEGVRLGGEIARESLLAGLAAFRDHGLRQSEISRKQTARWFEDCVRHGKALRTRIETMVS
jgi:hypothetical protein